MAEAATFSFGTTSKLTVVCSDMIDEGRRRGEAGSDLGRTGEGGKDGGSGDGDSGVSGDRGGSGGGELWG